VHVMYSLLLTTNLSKKKRSVDTYREKKKKDLKEEP
jgi:hypothetical protein